MLAGDSHARGDKLAGGNVSRGGFLAFALEHSQSLFQTKGTANRGPRTELAWMVVFVDKDAWTKTIGCGHRHHLRC